GGRCREARVGGAIGRGPWAAVRRRLRDRCDVHEAARRPPRWSAGELRQGRGRRHGGRDGARRGGLSSQSPPTKERGGGGGGGAGAPPPSTRRLPRRRRAAHPP